jgi:hypothetical protein
MNKGLCLALNSGHVYDNIPLYRKLIKRKQAIRIDTHKQDAIAFFRGQSIYQFSLLKSKCKGRKEHAKKRKEYRLSSLRFLFAPLASFAFNAFLRKEHQ